MNREILETNKIKIISLIFSVLILILDQATKASALKSLIYIKPYPIVELVTSKLNIGMNLFLTYNYGTAFSFIKSASGLTFFILLLCSMLVTVFLLYWLVKEHHTNRVSIMSVGAIIGGALGNIYDRITLGYVVDFIDVYAGRWHWPVFNIADMAISIGVLLLVWQLLTTKEES